MPIPSCSVLDVGTCATSIEALTRLLVFVYCLLVAAIGSNEEAFLFPASVLLTKTCLLSGTPALRNDGGSFPRSFAVLRFLGSLQVS